MRIVFMGTPDFAVPCLQRILADGHEVPAVFTQPDKPVGRHAVLTPPPVKQLAQERGIPVYQPTKMRDGTVAAQLKELAPDCLVVVAYGRILPQAILDVPPKGCINIHGSLLPKYRGAAPIQWSVINGEKITGVTSMFMDAGMDTGDIIDTITTPIGENETAGELFDRLAPLGAELLSRTLRSIADGTVQRAPQNNHPRPDAGKADGKAGLYPQRQGTARSDPRDEPLAGLPLRSGRQGPEDPREPPGRRPWQAGRADRSGPGDGGLR